MSDTATGRRWLVPHSIQGRLEVMGFHEGPTCPLLGADSGMRFTNGLCAAIMWLGAALRTPLVPWALAAISVTAVVLPRHPFDLLYNGPVRAWWRKPAIPTSPPTRRFSCGVATGWLVLVGVAFLFDQVVLGVILAAFQASIATVAATTRICLPSIVYRMLFGWPELRPGRFS